MGTFCKILTLLMSLKRKSSKTKYQRKTTGKSQTPTLPPRWLWCNDLVLRALDSQSRGPKPLSHPSWSIKWVGANSGNLAVKSNMPPRSGCVASRQLNSIPKKGRYNLVSYVCFRDLFTMLTTFSEFFHNYKRNSSDLPHSKPLNSNEDLPHSKPLNSNEDLPHSKPLNSNETINEGNKYNHCF